jgi:hypothetical protein
MVNIFIGGNTYMLREEIKALIPSSKTFTNKWRWLKGTKSWQLKVADSFMTEDFKSILENFSKKYSLTLEILEEIKPKIKSINDYDNDEAFFQDFHRRNGRRYF